MPGPILVLVQDLIFATKIRETARQVGVAVNLQRDLEETEQALDSSAGVILDLNLEAADALALARKVRQQSPEMRIVGYLSHVQRDLAAAARDAGIQQVLPRSEFSARLPEILRGLATPTGA